MESDVRRSVEEKGYCVFCHEEKVVKLQTVCTLLFSCLYNQDGEQNPISLEAREFLSDPGKTCIFLNINAFLKGFSLENFTS